MFNFPDADARTHDDELGADTDRSNGAILRATLDLQRLVNMLAQRTIFRPRAMPGYPAPAPTWRVLLVIEEQAFADPGFQARHPDALRHGFARLADSRFAGSDFDAEVDWQRDDDPLPAVYAIMRGLLQQRSAAAINQQS
ncbi:MAG: DUF2471 family protein [Paraburkholderia tropica]